ncbi:MAG: phage minor capsid protein [Ruthenibacterium sp.]
MTPDEIAAMQVLADNIAAPLNEYLIQDICRRVAKAGAITDTAEYQIYRAQALGMSRKAIADAVAVQMGINKNTMAQLFAEVTDRTVRFADNGELQQLTAAYAKITTDAANNMLKDLWAPAPDGKLCSISDVYEKMMDFAFGKIMAGASDANAAIRQATKELARRGIRTLPNGKSGHDVSIEYATRRYVLNRMGALHSTVSEMNHEKIGANGWELSAHGGSAEDHEAYQGRQYSDKEYEKMNAGLVRKIGTWQCRHVAYPIVLGISTPNYTQAQLDQMIKDNAVGVSYQGKHYTLYEAGQERAAIESGLRRRKLQCLASEASGDKEKLQMNQIRLNRLNEEYRRFCRTTKQRTRSERVAVANFDRSAAGKARFATKKAASPQPILQQLKYLNIVPKAQQLSIEKELSLLPDKIRVIAEMQISGIRMLDDNSAMLGGYDGRTKEILLQAKRDEGTVIHEYAHALERSLDLLHDPAFLEIRARGLENAIASDIIK